MSKLSLWRTICLLCLFCAFGAIGSSAQTFNTLWDFYSYQDGGQPISGLVQGPDGDFYGLTSDSYGTVFKITAAGALTTLHEFTRGDGDRPSAGLVQLTDGSFYGGAFNGGKFRGICGVGGLGSGTLFKGTPGVLKKNLTPPTLSETRFIDSYPEFAMLPA